MNGKFNEYSFTTLEAFGNMDVFINPFFEFTLPPGNSHIASSQTGFFALPSLYVQEFRSILSEKGTISILVVFYLRLLNGVGCMSARRLMLTCAHIFELYVFGRFENRIWFCFSWFYIGFLLTARTSCPTYFAPSHGVTSCIYSSKR